MDERAYQLLELAVARDPTHPRRSLPPVAPHHRRVLDIGCGAGQTLLATPFPPGTFRVGVDVAHEALVLGRELAPDLPLLGARGEWLPFASAAFDLLICRVALPYMHTGRAVAEMARVLAPGGDVWLVLHPWRMTVAELFAAARALRVRVALHRMYVLANSLLLHAAGREVAWPISGTHESFQTERAMRRRLRQAGFQQIAFQRGAAFVATARLPVSGTSAADAPRGAHAGVSE